MVQNKIGPNRPRATARVPGNRVGPRRQGRLIRARPGPANLGVNSRPTVTRVLSGNDAHGPIGLGEKRARPSSGSET